MTATSRALAPLLVCLFAASIALGMMSPLIGLLMNEAGLSRALIGANTAMFALAILLVAPFTAGLMRRLGTRWFLVGCLVLCAITAVAFKPFAPSFIWFPIRLAMGCGLAGLWVASEASINEIAEEHRRGFLIGIYATIHTLGFAAGAGLIRLLGTQGWWPFIIAAALMAGAAVPILLSKSLPTPTTSPPPPPVAERPSNSLAAPPPIRDYFRAVPFVMAGALVFGAIDLGVIAMLPVYGARTGFAQGEAALFVFAAAVASPVLQVPLGILADRVSRRRLLFGLGALGLLTAIGLPVALPIPVLRYGVLVLLSGASFGLYTVSLALLGQRFKGPDLAGANASFVFAYGIGALLGPPISGLAMDIWDPHGLAVFLAVLCAGYLIFGLRAAARRQVDDLTPPRR
jgi:MFS family permease